jgi:hypothetical protein
MLTTGRCRNCGTEPVTLNNRSRLCRPCWNEYQRQWRRGIAGRQVTEADKERFWSYVKKLRGWMSVGSGR